MTLVIAHRGASAAEAENTVAAFRRAVTMGADGIELDVRRTADDRLVVHHDAHLPDGRAIRTTRRADLPGHVPEFDDALDACEGAFVNVEIKNDPADPDFDPSEWVAHRTVAHVTRRGGGPRWLISSFRFETVDRCRRLAPQLRSAHLVYGLDADVIDRAASAGFSAVHPWLGGVSDAEVRRAHAAGLAVNVWTCNDPASLARLMSWGVDGVCTDVPDVAVAVRTSARSGQSSD